MLFGLYELALGLLAVIPLILLVFYSLRDCSIEKRALSFCYILGQILCWDLGFLGCFYLGPLNGFKIGTYTITTMVLLNLTIWSGVIGSYIALPLKFINCGRHLFRPLSPKFIKLGSMIFIIIFIVYTCSYFTLGFLYSRLGRRFFDYENDPLVYVLSAINFVIYPLFFFLGSQLSHNLFSIKNIRNLAITVFSMMLYGLSGGRGMSLYMFIYFLTGVLYTENGIKKMRSLLYFLLPFLILFNVIVGLSRSNIRFTRSPVSYRLKVIGTVSQDVLFNRLPQKTASFFFLFIARIAEPSGQTVIDSVNERHKYIGFKNFERILTLGLPKMLIGEKPPLDDGPERLKKDYGLRITETNSAPITLMADSFERGGYIAVILVSMLLSYYLTMLGRYITNFKNYSFRTILIASMSLLSLRLYAPSVLGVINVVVYQFLKIAILLSIVLW